MYEWYTEQDTIKMTPDTFFLSFFGVEYPSIAGLSG